MSREPGLSDAGGRDEIRSLERRYRQLTVVMSEGFALHEMIFDAQGEPTDHRILDVNPAFEHLVGLPRDAVIGRTACELFGPLPVDWLSVCAGVVRTGEPAQEERYHAKVGRWFEVRLYRTEPGRFATVFEDLTWQRRDAAQIQATHDLLQKVIDSSPDWIHATDPQGRVVFANHALAAAMGESPQALVGRDESQLAPALAGRGGGERPPNPMPDGTVRIPEDHRCLPDGRIRVMDTIRRPLRDDAGAVQGMLAYSRDITDRLALEEALRRSQKLESLGMLAGGVAHDFNNLLTAAIGNLNLAQARLPADSPAHRPLATLESAMLRAGELVRQMLAYAGRAPSDVRLVDLNKVVGSIAELLRASVPRAVHLQMDFAQDLPAVNADVAQIHQVVLNLVTNAAEAMAGRAGAIRLHTRLEMVDGTGLPDAVVGGDMPAGTAVLLEVSDQGCGMTPEVCERIFDPFFTTKETGRGLGLSAILGIVRSHGGGLCVRTVPGSGTTFKVYFPASQGAVPRAAATPCDAPPLFGRVLFVDDEDILVETVAALLTALGMAVDTARSGERALALLRERASDYDLVILDLTMPRVGGREVYRDLRQIRPNLPVLLSSGYHPIDDGSLPSGVDGFLPKPYSREELRAAVLDVLRRRERARP